MTQKSIIGIIPKHPPNVAAYTIGTHGFVPNITRCAPINPKGKGNANKAATIFFFSSVLCVGEKVESVTILKDAVGMVSVVLSTVSVIIIETDVFSADVIAFV
jgi:hypothetical protein